VHFAVALLPEIPQPLVVHFLVLGGTDEARGGLGLVDRPIAVNLGATRLFLGLRPQRLRRRLRVIEATARSIDAISVARGVQFGMKDVALVGIGGGHSLAPFRI
jgi:hypothetical protein